MGLSPESRDRVARLQAIGAELKSTYVDKDLVVDLMALALITREHLLLLGPPGTAKSALIKRMSTLLDARYYEYLLTRFSEPSELFGPVDLAALQDGRYSVKTAGMAPEAEIVFLDEIFKANSAILNALLSLINERVFYNGNVRQEVPLVSVMGASNDLPTDTSLGALFDRFLLRVQTESVPDEKVEDLLESGWSLEVEGIRRASGTDASPAPKGRSKASARSAAPAASPSARRGLSVADLLGLHGELGHIDLRPVLREYHQVIREVRAEGIPFSDRRSIKSLKLIAASAMLRGDASARARDLWPLVHTWSRPEQLGRLQEIVLPRVEADGGAALTVDRPLDEVVTDLGLLEAEAGALRGEASFLAHLRSLGNLRRELLGGQGDRARRDELLARCDRMVEATLARMGTVTAQAV
ncbi:AAA family ATPase [Myxococcota bacterium]|nr:AAA family ATPase [Myxococcota bacterium]